MHPDLKRMFCRHQSFPCAGSFGEAEGNDAVYAGVARPLVLGALRGAPGLRAHSPSAGMFAMVDVRGTGLTGEAFARRLLDHGVAVTPADAWGDLFEGHVRVGLVEPPEALAAAAERMAACAAACTAP